MAGSFEQLITSKKQVLFVSQHNLTNEDVFIYALHLKEL
jgi:hypothetical protein